MSEKIPKGWKWVKLGEVAEVVGGFAFKSQHFGKHGTPVVKIKDIKPPYIDVEELEKVDTSFYNDKNLKKYYIEKDDFVLAMTGATIGKIGILKRDLKLLINQRVAKIAPKDMINKAFIYYSINNNTFQQFIQNNIDSNSAQENISSQSIGRFPILLPPLPEQKAIAEVLSSLDDKIDLLHRQNKTLEEMAMTLFRQWFIEPTKDGLPEGWEEVSLGEIIEISSGKSIEKGKLKEKGLYPVLGANGEIGRTDDWLYEGELIYTGRVGTLGNVFIVFKNEKVWLTDNTLVIKPKKNEYFYFVYFTLKNAKLDEYNSGSTQPLIRQSDIKKIEIFLPKINFLKDFEVISRNLFTKIQFNTSQIQTLEKLRDTLLPKLMSGKVKIMNNE
jgi:type I restriction enzyme S subunit